MLIKDVSVFFTLITLTQPLEAPINFKGEPDELMANASIKRTLPWAGSACTTDGCRPSFLIIGAGKSGTSSLYYYLQDHPEGS
jgi:hypothetical protein